LRRFEVLTLALALAAIVTFAAYYGFVHGPDSGGRAEQAFYAGALLIPPALFLLLALVLAHKKATGAGVLALVGIAALVGAPTLVFFLGNVIGLSLTAAASLVVGATSTLLNKRSAVDWPDEPVDSS
jgi:hypothetical protein